MELTGIKDKSGGLDHLDVLEFQERKEKRENASLKTMSPSQRRHRQDPRVLTLFTPCGDLQTARLQVESFTQVSFGGFLFGKISNVLYSLNPFQ